MTWSTDAAALRLGERHRRSSPVLSPKRAVFRAPRGLSRAPPAALLQRAEPVATLPFRKSALKRRPVRHERASRQRSPKIRRVHDELRAHAPPAPPSGATPPAPASGGAPAMPARPPV